MVDNKPPFDLEAEQILLGGLLIDPEQFSYIDSLIPIGEKIFYATKHKAIYKAMKTLTEENKSFDIILLYNEVHKHNKDITRSELVDIYHSIPTSAMNERYVHHLLEVYSRRKTAEICKNTLHGITIATPLDELLGTLIKEVSNISVVNNDKEASSINEVGLTWWDNYLNNEGKPIPRVLTGWEDLDRYVALMNGTHTIIGARTSMGKTSFAINLCTNVAQQGKKPLFFTMEQTKESVATCYISQISNVDRFNAMTGKLTEDDKKRIMDNAHIWGSDNISSMRIYDRSWSASEVRHKILLERIHRPVDIVVIDFLHNMKPPHGMNREGHEWLRETSQQLEEIAIELNIPIVTLAQLNRKVESREDKRPFLSDIREAGEDNADIVMFIYRDEYYYPDTTNDPGVAEIIISKNRHGKTGTIKLDFIPHSTAFITKKKNYTPVRRQASWTEAYDV